MTKKLVQHGNSAALILDKAILKLLNVAMDTPLEITRDGRNIVIAPASSNSESEFMASLDRINSRFAQTLHKLSEQRMKSDPRFLSLSEVLTVLRDQITRYGGTFGVRGKNASLGLV